MISMGPHEYQYKWFCCKYFILRYMEKLHTLSPPNTQKIMPFLQTYKSHCSQQLAVAGQILWLTGCQRALRLLFQLSHQHHFQTSLHWLEWMYQRHCQQYRILQLLRQSIIESIHNSIFKTRIPCHSCYQNLKNILNSGKDKGHIQ